MASGPITSWQIDGETVETVTDFTFLDSKITADGDCSYEIKRCLLLGRKVMTNLDSILKTIAFSRWIFVGKVISLLFNMLSRLVITFLPRSKHVLISWLKSTSAVILEPPKKSLTLFPLFPHLFPMKWWDQKPWSSFSEYWTLSQLFPLSTFTFIKRLFSSSSLSAIRVVSSAYLRLLIFLPAILVPACASFQPSVSHDVLCI